MERGRGIEAGSKTPEIAETEHVTLEARAVAVKHDIRQDALHTSVIEVLDDVHHADSARH
jgi:hypothetical protein